MISFILGFLAASLLWYLVIYTKLLGRTLYIILKSFYE